MTLLQQLCAVLLEAAPMSERDIILRTLIGMVFIMALLWLAAIVTAKVGQRHGQQPDREQEDTPSRADPAGEESVQDGQD